MRARGMVAGVGLALLIQATAAAAGPCESTACRSHFTVRDRVSQWRSAQLFEGFKGTVRLYAAGRRLPAKPMADGCGTTFAGQHVRARLRFCGNRVPLRIAYRGAPGVRVTVVYRALAPAVPASPSSPPTDPQQPPAPPPPPPPPPAASLPAMYWGATIDGEVYGTPDSDAPWDQTVWNTFEQHAGKKVTFVNFGQGWLEFNTLGFQAIQNRGAIPLVTMPLGSRVTLADVAAGKVDRAIRTWAQAAKSWGYPFLFRPWWEVNGDWYPWGRDPDPAP